MNDSPASDTVPAQRARFSEDGADDGLTLHDWCRDSGAVVGEMAWRVYQPRADISSDVRSQPNSRPSHEANRLRMPLDLTCSREGSSAPVPRPRGGSADAGSG